MFWCSVPSQASDDDGEARVSCAMSTTQDNIVSEQPAAVGIVEMGGASLQVTFVAERAAPALFTVPLGSEQGASCTLFTHSFAGWGREAALARVVRGRRSACFHEGYTSPEGTSCLQCLP